MPFPSSKRIAGFDFEKNVVLLKTGLALNEEPVYDTLPITADDKEIICDAWLDYKSRQR